jgi:hypothetical protein
MRWPTRGEERRSSTAASSGRRAAGRRRAARAEQESARPVDSPSAIALSGRWGLPPFRVVASLRLAGRDSLATADSQRLGAEANGILQRGESAGFAALAIRGIQAQYTPQAAPAALPRQQFSDRIITLPSGDGLAVSADGRFLLAGSGDGKRTRRLTAATSGRSRPSDFVPDADFSPTERCSTIDTAIHLWTRVLTERWTVVRRAAGHDLPDSRSLVPAGWIGHAARCRGWSSPEQVLILTEVLFLALMGERRLTRRDGPCGSGQRQSSASSSATREITNAVFSPDSTRATSSYDETARIWEVATGETLQCLPAHGDRLPVRLLARWFAAPDRKPGHQCAPVGRRHGHRAAQVRGPHGLGLFGGIHHRRHVCTDDGQGRHDPLLGRQRSSSATRSQGRRRSCTPWTTRPTAGCCSPATPTGPHRSGTSP